MIVRIGSASCSMKSGFPDFVESLQSFPKHIHQILTMSHDALLPRNIVLLPSM